MDNLPPCPACGSEYTYEDRGLYICPSCAHEWQPGVATVDKDDARVYKDAHGTVLQDGDSVTLIKDLKIQGTSQVIKIGTLVKNIRLIEGDHDIDCKVPGVGPMKLKTQFVKKVN